VSFKLEEFVTRNWFSFKLFLFRWCYKAWSYFNSSLCF